jgi:hypothetical protein
LQLLQVKLPLSVAARKGRGDERQCSSTYSASRV